MPALRSAAIAVLVTACVASRSSEALEWTAIAGTGDPATGLPVEAPIVSLGVFDVLGEDGEVFFSASTGSVLTSRTEPTGLYRWRADGKALLVGYGEDPGLAIDTPIRIDVNRRGVWAIADWPEEVSFGCDPVTSEARAERLLRSNGAGGFDVLIEMGASIPGAPEDLRYAGIARWPRPPRGVFSRTVGPDMILAESGALAFGAGLATDPCGSDIREAILAVSPSGEIALAALSGEAAPGLSDGMVIDEVWLSAGGLDDAGRIAFWATLRSDTEIASAVYRWDPVAGVELVAVLVPPFVPEHGVTYELLGRPVIGATGAVAFRADSEVWGPDGSGGVARRFAVGDPVPGGPEGATFRWQSYFPVLPPRVWINARDQLAFVAGMERTGSGEWPEPLGSGVFRAGVRGPIELLVKSGDVAPYAGGATFEETFEVMAFGDRGEIAFRAWLDRPGSETLNGDEAAVYLIDADGHLFPVLLVADLDALLALDAYGHDPGGASLAFDSAFSRAAMSPRAWSGPSAVFIATVPESRANEGALAAFLALVTQLHFARCGRAFPSGRDRGLGRPVAPA